MDVIKKIRNYTVNERHCLGEGSFGKVYEATSDEGRKVAIKKVDQKLIISDRYLKESLDNEISIMQKLKHPNIVELYEVITTANNIYLIMEFCSGGDLKRYCTTRKVNQQMAYKILTQIVKGFQEMVRFGIIHRDLKPANILVDKDNFKICDFGFAKLFGQAGKMARTFVGTPIYMSPQVLNQKNYTNKTDVWSLGVMFYELLFGKLPFSGFSEQDLYRNIMGRGLVIPENSSKQTQRILRGMMAVDEANRWSWNEVFDQFLGKGNRVRANTPVQNGLFYNQNQQGKKQTSTDNHRRAQKKSFDNNYRNQVARDNYVDNNVYDRDRLFQKPYKDLHDRNYEKKPPVGRNMMIAQQQSTQDIYMAPIQAKNPSQEERSIEDNPRFYYFILVEFIVNPMEGSLSFDSFMYTLWKSTIALYEKVLEKPEVNSIQLYKNVLANELQEVRNLENQFQVKKQGNLRSLADIVLQQAKANNANKKRLIWLKRFVEKKYNYDTID